MFYDSDSDFHGTAGGDQKFGFYTSTASATQADIAVNLTANINQNLRDLVKKPLFVEMVTNGTFTALTNNATVVKDVTTVTSTAHGLSVGSLVRIGGTGATNPVYRVVTVPTANTFTIHMPYQGASGTVLAANIGAMTVVTAYGIKQTGLSPYFTTTYVDNFHVNRWSTVLNRFGNTPQTITQFPTEGAGEYGQVASVERYLVGEEGMIYNYWPDRPVRTNVEVGGTYSQITLTHRSKVPFTTIDTNYGKALVIYANKSGGFIANSHISSAVVTAVEPVLEAFVGVTITL
jgi:hypothetical protein